MRWSLILVLPLQTTCCMSWEFLTRISFKNKIFQSWFRLHKCVEIWSWILNDKKQQKVLSFMKSLLQQIHSQCLIKTELSIQTSSFMEKESKNLFPSNLLSTKICLFLNLTGLTKVWISTSLKLINKEKRSEFSKKKMRFTKRWTELRLIKKNEWMYLKLSSKQVSIKSNYFTNIWMSVKQSSKFCKHSFKVVWVGLRFGEWSKKKRGQAIRLPITFISCIWMMKE